MAVFARLDNAASTPHDRVGLLAKVPRRNWLGISAGMIVYKLYLVGIALFAAAHVSKPFSYPALQRLATTLLIADLEILIVTLAIILVIDRFSLAVSIIISGFIIVGTIGLRLYDVTQIFRYGIPLDSLLVAGLGLALGAFWVFVRPSARRTIVVIVAIAQLTLPSVLYFFFVVKPLDLDLLVQYSFTWFISNFLPACVLLTVLGLYLPAVSRRRQRRKQAGLVRHCVAAFSRYAESSASGRKKQAEVARKLSDRELFWAYALPDHSPSGKESAAQELERRGHSRGELDSWKPDPSELTAPGAVDFAISPSEYVALSRAKQRYFLFYKNVGVWCVALLAFWGLLGFANSVSENSNLGSRALVWIAFIWALGLFFFVGVRFRNRALRILLLRPFGEKEMTAALSAFVTENVGKIGYVLTLSDQHYKPNLLLRLIAELPGQFFAFFVMYALGPLMRNSMRIATVKNERTFRKLQNKLMRQARPSFFSFLSGDQAFNIRSTDPWWQFCIQMLMHSCEIIVVDLSKVKAGTRWELTELHRRSLHDKCAFVAGQGNEANLGEVFAEHFNKVSPKVFLYGNDGQVVPEQAEQFAAVLARLTTAGLESWDRQVR